MEQKFGINSILGRAKRPSRADIEVLREFCEREGKMVEYRKGVTFSEKEFQIFTKPLNICSDFHLGRHFFGHVGGFFVGLFVTSQSKIIKSK
jgi:hypothetical protein